MDQAGDPRLARHHYHNPMFNADGIPDTPPSKPEAYHQVGTSDTELEPVTTTEVPPRRRSRSIQAIFKEWWWELLTWFFGTCAFASLITLLIYYKDKSLDHWNSEIQLSTIIATLAQATQSSLMVAVPACIGQLQWPWLKSHRSMIDIHLFDEATRGPNGSFWLLWKLGRTIQPHLVAVGALATILMLGFGPFAQETVETELRTYNIARDAGLANSNLSDAHATIPRSVQYSAGGSLFHADGASYLLNKGLQGAVFSAFLGDTPTLSSVSGFCPTTNCTWEPYTTLGWCAVTEDISSSLTKRSNDSAIILPGLNVTAPAGKLWAQYQSFWAITVGPEGSTGTPSDEVIQTYLPNETWGDIYVAYYPPCSLEPEGSFSDGVKDATKWKAFKGTLKPCLQTLRSQVTNSTASTEILETKTDLQWDLRQMRIPQTVTNYNASFYCHDAEGGANETFCMRGVDIHSVWEQGLQPIFNGSASYWPGGDNYFVGQWLPLLSIDLLGSPPESCNPSPELGFKSFTRKLDDIATSLTNALRSDRSSSNVEGTAWMQEQYFHVSLVWLAGPIAIYVIVTVFVFWTVIVSRKSDVPIWKSSSLAFLRAMDQTNEMDTLKVEERLAESTSVQLKHSGANWYLREDAVQRRPHVMT